MRPAQDDRLARPFTPDATRSILMAACRDVGMDGASAVLLRHGENSVYRLVHHPVVARIARHADVPHREVAVAAWLADSDFPAVRVCDGPDQLLVIDGRVVTWWDLIAESPEKLDFEDLASVLRRLHDLAPPTTASLPVFDPMPRVLGRLTAAGANLAESDREFLAGRHSQLQAAYESLSFDLKAGPIHGDAHLGNLMRREDGVVVLIDLEAFAWGPREWDASVFAAAWSAFRTAVEDAIWAGNNAGLAYLAEKAGYTRTGHHGGEAGRWADAHEWVVASFLQHDSREHDPHLHIHNALLNRVEGPDGEWLTIDGRSLFRWRPAAAAVAERTMAEHLTHALGVLVATRPDGKAWESCRRRWT